MIIISIRLDKLRACLKIQALNLPYDGIMGIGVGTKTFQLTPFETLNGNKPMFDVDGELMGYASAEQLAAAAEKVKATREKLKRSRKLEKAKRAQRKKNRKRK